MSERERGNKVITWSIVIIIFGVFNLLRGPSAKDSDVIINLGIIAIISGFLFLGWGFVLRGPSKTEANHTQKKNNNYQSSFWYNLIIGVLASIIGGLLLMKI